MNPKYRVDDESGPLRYFFSKKEALRWTASRPNLRLIALPKAKGPVDWDDFEAAIF